MVDYTLIRARRRTAAIQIQKDGQVVVRAPMRLPKKEIERFLQEKESWILAQQQRMRQRQQRREQFALSDGRLPLLGKFFPLEQTDSAKPSYQDGVFCLPRGAGRSARSWGAVGAQPPLWGAGAKSDDLLPRGLCPLAKRLGCPTHPSVERKN